MATAFPAIITNQGLSDALNSTNNGWTINVTNFSVAATAGALDPSRTTPNTEIYKANIAGFEKINQNQVKVVVEIPALAEYPLGNALDEFEINEVYLYAQNDYVTISYTPVTGLFVRPESITSTGGAVGTVISNSVTGGVGTLIVKVTSGTFAASQTITGGTSTATGAITGVAASTEKLFWIGQPDPIPYYPVSTVSFDIVISLTNISEILSFTSTQATEITNHEVNPNAHPLINTALEKYGIFVDTGDFTYSGQQIDESPVFDAAVTDGTIVYRKNSDHKYYKALADGTVKQKGIGWADVTGNRVIFKGLIQTVRTDVQGTSLYLSDSVLGGITTSSTSAYIGVSLGNDGVVMFDPSSDSNTALGWTPVAISASADANPNELIFVDTTSSAITVTLPGSASLGDQILIIDNTGNAYTNNITISRNGNTIQNEAEDFVMDVNYAIVHLIYENSNWVLDLSGVNIIGGGYIYKNTVDPTPSDDTYFIGARWLNTVTNQMFMCLSASTGNAVWQKMGSALITSHVSDPTASDDGTAGYSAGDIWINTITQTAFICASAVTSAAVWFDVRSTIQNAAAPTQYDNSYQVGTVWIDTTTNDAYMCLDKSALTAKWAKINFDNTIYEAGASVVSGDIVRLYNDGGTAKVKKLETYSNTFNIANSGSSTTLIKVCYLSSGQYVIVYSDGGNSSYGTAQVMSGGTLGAKYVFASVAVTGLSISAEPNANQVFVGYTNGTNSYVISATLSGVALSFGSASDLGTADTIHVQTVTTGYGLAVYRGSSTIKGRVVTIGTGNALTLNTEAVSSFNSTVYQDLCKISATKFCVTYGKDTDAHGWSLIGSVSGTTLTWAGTEYEFYNGTVDYNACVSPDGTNLVVTYSDTAAGGRLCLKYGAVSSTAITWDADPTVLDNADCEYIDLCAGSSTNLYVVYQDKGNSSYGSYIWLKHNGSQKYVSHIEGVFNSATTSHIACANISATQVLVGWSETNGAFTTLTATDLANTLSGDYATTCNRVSDGCQLASQDIMIVGHYTDGQYSILYGQRINAGVVGTMLTASWPSGLTPTITPTISCSAFSSGYFAVARAMQQSSSWKVITTICTPTALQGGSTDVNNWDTGLSSAPYVCTVSTTTGIVCQGDKVRPFSRSGSTLTYGTEYDFTSDTVLNSYIFKVDTGKACVIWDTSGATKAKILNTDGSTITSVGSDVTVLATGTSSYNTRGLAGCSLSTSQVVIASINGNIVPCGISGNTITAGNSSTFASVNDTDGLLSINNISSSTFILCTTDISGTSGTTRYGQVVGSNIFLAATSSVQSRIVVPYDSTYSALVYYDQSDSGTGYKLISKTESSVAAGIETFINASTASNPAICFVNTNKIVIAFTDIGNGNALTVQAATVNSDYTLTMGPEVTITGVTGTTYNKIIAINDDKFVVIGDSSGTSKKLCCGTVSGTTITIGSVATVSSTTCPAVHKLVKLANDSFALFYAISGSSHTLRGSYCTVTGTTITINSASDIVTGLHADISSGVNVLDSALNGVSGTSYSLALAYGGPSSNVPGAIKSVYYDTVSGWSVSAATAISANRIDPISLFKHDTNKFLVFTSDTAGAGFAYYTENVGSNSGDPYVSQKIQTTIENVKNFQSVIKSGNSHYINLYTPSTGNSALKIAVGIFEPYTIKQKQSFQTALTVTNYAVDTSYTTDTWAYITINSAGSALSIWVGGYYFNVEKMVGVAQESATAGNNVIISPFGKTSSVHTSLTPGTTYYVDYSGNITETQSAIKVGVAQSSTVLLLDKGNS